jgi:pullulanase/glycogen debranching enzyme
MQTLREVEAAVHREFPRALLISEPWSSRGDHKERLGGTGWAAWNNIFRDTAKHYALGSGDRERLCRVLEGSTSLWASSPLQSINYLESHDDICLADELTANPGRDGRKITAEDAARHRLAATLLLTSFGIPMIGEGQEFVRSKRGLRNTFDQGDEINALNWQDRERPAAAEVLRYYRGLLALRASPAGESLRRGARDPSGRLLWILPPETRAVGYVIGRADERALVVLVNASDGEVPFDVPFRAGTWLRVGDGQRVSPDGLGTPLALAAPATRRIAVPARTAWLFRSN